MSLPSIALTPELVTRFFGLLLVAWQPLPSGPRMPSILLTVIGFWLLFRGQIDLKSETVKRFGLIMLLLLVPVLISLPASYHPASTLNVAIAIVLFVVAGLALMRGLQTKAAHAWLQRWLMIVLLIWLADGYIQYLFGTDLLGVPLSSDGRIVGPFEGNLRYGLFMTVLMPIMLWYIAKERPLLALVIISLVGFIATMSGARTNLLFFLMACATLLPRFNWIYRGLLAVSSAVVLVLAITASPVISESVQRIDALQADSGATLFQKLDHILSGRMTIWETGVRMLGDRPLTGVGANAFAEAYDRYSTRPDDPFHSSINPNGVYHAHQMYVAIAAETGLIGLITIIVSIGLCVRWFLLAHITQRNLAAPYAACLLVVVFPVQSQPVLYTIWWFPVILLLLGGMIAALGVAANNVYKKDP